MPEAIKVVAGVILGVLLATLYLTFALARELFCAFIATIPFWVFGNLGAQLLVILVWMVLAALGSAPFPSQIIGEFTNEGD